MKARDAIEIFRLYDVLPGHGETSIELSWNNGVARIVIHYDSDAENVNRMVFVFEHCVACELASFPGISTYENDRKSNIDLLGSLVEFTTSQYADLWNKHFGNINKGIRHFSVLFLSANKQVNVFAEEFNIVVE